MAREPYLETINHVCAKLIVMSCNNFCAYPIVSWGDDTDAKWGTIH